MSICCYTNDACVNSAQCLISGETNVPAPRRVDNLGDLALRLYKIILHEISTAHKN